MKVLFVLCEGPHDAQFIGRLLDASGQFEPFKQSIRKYPKPLDRFLGLKFQHHDIDSIVIGRPNHPLIPVLAYRHRVQDILVLPYPMGGINKVQETTGVLSDIRSISAPDILQAKQSDIDEYAILFVYDADNRGRDATMALFAQNYSESLGNLEGLQPETWHNAADLRMGVFIYTDADGDTGTLEDNLVALFTHCNAELVNGAFGFLDAHSDHQQDTVEHLAKLNKAGLTVCGQAERKNAGSALTVIIRDTALLNGAFDFGDPDSQWSRMLSLINGAFDVVE